MSVNKVILVGNVGQDPVVRGEGSSKVANISLATTERYKKDGQAQTKTEWHRVSIWGGMAGIVEQYVKKGSMLYIEGKLQTRKYQQDGQDKYSTDVVVGVGGVMKMLGGGSSQNNNQSSSEDGGNMGMPPMDMDNMGDDIPF